VVMSVSMFWASNCPSGHIFSISLIIASSMVGLHVKVSGTTKGTKCHRCLFLNKTALPNLEPILRSRVTTPAL
jgi:hypothetical protein